MIAACRVHCSTRHKLPDEKLRRCVHLDRGKRDTILDLMDLLNNARITEEVEEFENFVNEYSKFVGKTMLLRLGYLNVFIQVTTHVMIMRRQGGGLSDVMRRLCHAFCGLNRRASGR